MKYTKTMALALLNILTEMSDEVLGSRLTSSYALGSLAHGGFSAQCSDIDFLVILADPINHASDHALIAEIKTRVEARNLPMANRISIFWSSVGELQNPSGQGRMPAIDKLDFILNAKCLSGKDIRNLDIPRPTQFDLDISSASFIVEVFFGIHFREYITNPQASILNKQNVIALTKALLFPVRLLYTLETGNIGENKVSTDYYVNNYQNYSTPWVKNAYQWRNKQPDFSKIQPNELMAAIRALYTQMMEAYIKRMLQYGEAALAHKLISLKENLSSSLGHEVESNSVGLG